MAVLAALCAASLSLVYIASAQAQDATKRPIRVIAFGDSLTAGYGVAASQAFPVRLQAHLRSRGHAVEVVNAGVSGDTTAAGLERFDWAVPDDADAVILELGANDALRGIAPAETRKNLEAILNRLAVRRLPVLLVGMRAPGNWGEAYRQDFDPIFADLASKHGVLMYPFFLDGVALDPKLNQADGLHPNAQGVSRIVDLIAPQVEKLLDRARAARKTQ